MREKYGMTPTEGYGSECESGGLSPTPEFFRCLAQHQTAPENHQVGTCKMGPRTDPMAVVDMQLRVHGIKGRFSRNLIVLNKMSCNKALRITRLVVGIFFFDTMKNFH